MKRPLATTSSAGMRSRQEAQRPWSTRTGAGVGPGDPTHSRVAAHPEAWPPHLDSCSSCCPHTVPSVLSSPQRVSHHCGPCLGTRLGLSSTPTQTPTGPLPSLFSLNTVWGSSLKNSSRVLTLSTGTQSPKPAYQTPQHGNSVLCTLVMFLPY